MMVLALQDEIRRNKDARYDHRLHAVLLVAQGNTCEKVASDLGDSPRSIHAWVNAFNRNGFAGLSESEHPGRPSRLTAAQVDEIGLALRKAPVDFGLPGNNWDGKTLSAFIKQKYQIEIGVRQSQRLFGELGFHYRKPRPMILGSSPEVKEEFKKTSDP
jgi:transposase